MHSHALFALVATLPALAANHVIRYPAYYAAAAERELDERLLPITTTTTVVDVVTRTNTIWVDPTPHAPESASVSSVAQASTTDSATASASITSHIAAASSSPISASWSGSESSSPVSSTSSEDLHSSTASASSEPSASVSASASALSSGTQLWVPPPSETGHGHGHTTSESASASATHHTASESVSASAESSSAAETSAEVSATLSSSSARATSIASSSASRSVHTLLPSSSSEWYSASAEPSASDWYSSSVAPSASASASAWSEDPWYSASASAYDSSILASATSSESPWWTASASESASVSASATSSYDPWAVSASASASVSYTNTSAYASATSAVFVASSTSAFASSTSTSSKPAHTARAGTMMMGYYPDWSAYYLPPETVDFSKFDILDFAFAIPTADGKLVFTQDDSSSLLHRLATAAHAHGKLVKLSVGGWTGSADFSTITASDWLRSTFVQSIVDAYHNYNLDGIDIDWEYPGTPGAGGNAVSPSDTANYLVFLQDLRNALPSEALITVAAQVWPFADSNGRPLTDVSAFADVLDWVLIMNYDVWGSSSTPGPNAPLSDGCGNSTQPLANAYASVASWTSAGMPANKLVLGVPAYGYLQSSSASSLRQRRSMPQLPHKRYVERDSVTVNNGNGGTSDGQVMFYSLITQGALTDDGNGGYTGAGGFTRHWDECSSTPWLKSEDSGQVITYDDTESMSLKGQFAQQAGLKGCNVFSVDGDWTGSSWPLTDAVRSGLGL